MKKILRKTLVIIVLFAPLFTNTDCKKQKRCGCGKDVLYSLTGSPSYVYFDSESPIITMRRLSDQFSFYTFCNPDEIKPKIANFRSGEELMVSGNVYWDCNYVWQQSQSYGYQSSLYQSYTIHVTDIYMNMYGKDDSTEELKKGF